MKNFVSQNTKNKINLLITNVGRRVYFIDFIKKIKLRKTKINIFCADNNIYAPSMNIKGSQIKKVIIPKFENGSKKYLFKIINIVKKYKIDLIIPLTDYDISILSKNKKNIKKYNKCDVLISDFKFVKSCMNKISFNKFCVKNNFFTPKIYKKRELKKVKFPAIKKLIYGSASKNIEIFNSKKFVKNIDF